MKAADVLQQEAEVLKSPDFFAQRPQPVLNQTQKSRLHQVSGHTMGSEEVVGVFLAYRGKWHHRGTR